MHKVAHGIFVLSVLLLTPSCAVNSQQHGTFDDLETINIEGQYSFNGNGTAKLVQVGDMITIFFYGLPIPDIEARGKITGNSITGQWVVPETRYTSNEGWNYFHAKILNDGNTIDLAESTDQVAISMSSITLFRR